MSNDEDRLRIRAAQSEARDLGYVLGIDEAPNMPAPITHMVHAHPVTVSGQATVGRFLCYSTSAADAAEAGLEIVRRVVEHGEPWPEDD